MNTPAIIKKETLKNLPYGMNSTGNYTPYWIKDGIKESFICNLVERSIFGHKEDKSQRSEVAERLLNLRANQYKFIKFYCGMGNTPTEFLANVIKNKYTLERHGEFIKIHDDLGCADFHGNLSEVSCAFSFRIYDIKTLKEIQKLLGKVKINIHY